MRTTSPVIGSFSDVCVVALLHVAVDVTVALCAIGGGGATGRTTDDSANSRGGGGAEKRRPVAESGGDTSPGLRLVRRRSVEEMELEWARDLRLLTVTPRECCEFEFEFDVGADPDALRECAPA